MPALAGFVLCILYVLVGLATEPVTAHFYLLHTFPLDPPSFAPVGQFASSQVGQPDRIGLSFRPHLFIVDFEAVPNPRQP